MKPRVTRILFICQFLAHLFSLNSLVWHFDEGVISGHLMELLNLVVSEGVDGEVDVDEDGHSHNDHQVHVQNDLQRNSTIVFS
jgi:hypothetical protein